MNRSVVRTRWSWFLLAAVVLMLAGCTKKVTPGATPPPEAQSEEKGKVIRLVAGASTAPGYVEKEKEKASRSHDKHNHVRWSNETAVRQAIKFTRPHWIFMEPFEDSVLVEPGARTQWFTLREDADLMEHKYTVTPLLSSGPPGEPSITADP